MDIQTPPPTTIIPLCEHLLTDPKKGPRRCGSPAMRGTHFCYYHRQNRRPRGAEIIPDLRSRRNIQRALSNVLQAAIHGRLSSEEAGRIVNGISVAMRTLPPLRAPLDASQMGKKRVGPR